MIELTNTDKILLKGHNSKGAQMKFYKDGYWYKVDELGYEGLAEVVSSRILQDSNIDNFVFYEEEQIRYGKNTFNGCKSLNFKPSDAEIITVAKLFEVNKGTTSIIESCKESTIEDTVYHVISDISKFTHIPINNIGIYITQLVELDALILNGDRHFNNIAFLHRDDRYQPCPIFDNGDAFLSDYNYYSSNYIEDDIEKFKKRVKPFNLEAEDQVKICQKLFGKCLNFSEFNIQNYIPQNSIYENDIIARVNDIVNYQFSQYEYEINEKRQKILNNFVSSKLISTNNSLKLKKS